MHIHIGKRIIKTAITLFIVLLIYIALLALDNLFEISHDNFKAPSNMYTPFFAGIAAVYATHQNRKLSIKQAKVRSIGSIVGGYFGMIIVFLYELVALKLFSFENNIILFNLIRYIIISLSIIPLIVFTVKIKQVDAVFITCLTFLSVTISQRNGGMPVLQFATNRVLSTLIGVAISLFVNSYLFTFKKCNKNILFVSALERNFLSDNEELSPYVKYKLNELNEYEIPFVFATTKSAASFDYIFKGVNISQPMVLMNGAAKYHLNTKKYDKVYHIHTNARQYIDKILKDHKMNAFIYTINENTLHAYHNKLVNEGEKLYYNHKRERNSYSFVRAELPSDLKANLYTIIDTKQNVDKIKYLVETSLYKNEVNVVENKYKCDERGNEYWILRISSSLSNKLNSIKSIYLEGKYDTLVVLASGKSDLELVKKADLSICLSNAQDYVKDECDIVIDGDSEKLLKLIDKIYHSNNANKIINSIKKEG